MKLFRVLKEFPGISFVIIVCSIIFLLINIGIIPNMSSSGTAILLGAYYKPFVLAGEWWRLFTVGFVHVSFWHFFMNLYAFLNMGLLLERHYGTWKFLAILFLSVIGGSLFLMIKQNTLIAVGLSGGLYGCMAAIVMLMTRSGYLKSPQVRASLIQTLLINLMINFMPNVGYMAHLGGFITGFLLAVGFDAVDGEKGLNIHSIIATIALLGILGYYCFTRVNLNQSQRYYALDVEILNVEKNLGFNAYVDYMAQNLDQVYKNTIISDYMK